MTICSIPPDLTGQVDLPTRPYKEAIAAAVAKAQGKLPARIAKMVEEILEPQVSWRDKLRLTVTGIVGARKEDWSRVNRRRIVTQPIIYLPGKKGHGANTVVVAMDTSGSIYSDAKALNRSSARSRASWPTCVRAT
jgi:predicted metal-dependent peptidase